MSNVTDDQPHDIIAKLEKQVKTETDPKIKAVIEKKLEQLKKNDIKK